MMKSPSYVIALLRDLANELDRIMWNLNQEEYSNPFENSGNVEGFKTDVFEVHAYDWGWDAKDDTDTPQPVNFKCGDLEITWYKYLGRGTWLNRAVTPEEMVEVYNKCLLSILLYEWAEDRKRGEYRENKPSMDWIE